MKLLPFELISVTGTKTWMHVDGETREIVRTFAMRVSPLARNWDGSRMTREQVLKEVEAQRDAWLMSDLE